MAAPTTNRVLTRSGTALGDWRPQIRLALVVVDLAAMAIALTAAIVLRFGSEPTEQLSGIGYPVVAVIIGLLWFFALHYQQCYNPDYLGVGYDEYRRVLRGTFGVFGAIAIGAVAFRLPVARGFLAIAFPLGLLLLEVGRLVTRRILQRLRTADKLCDRVVLIGSANEVRYVAEMMNRTRAAGYLVAAVATGEDATEFELSDGTHVPQLGALIPSTAELTRWEINTLVIAGHSQVSRQELREISWRLEGSALRLAVASSMTDVAGPRIHWRPVDGLPLMSVETPEYSGTKYLAKRVFDVVVSLSLLLLLSPVLLAAAIAVRLDGAPVFYRQVRVGVNGALFRMTKFRSMEPDADARLTEVSDRSDGNGVLFKLKDDPRVTRVGKVLRRYSIDELPQLFDVLSGTMSLVGPRPPLPSEVNTYEKHVHRRLNVKPGITGPWQVGGRSNLSWAESVRKDLYYVENWSLTGDVIILFKTIRAVLERDGAY